MKKYFLYVFLAILLPMTLAGCFLKKEAKNETVATDQKVYSFNFTVANNVSDEDKDNFLQAIKRRATAYIAGKISADLTEGKNLKIEVTPDQNIIFDEAGFKNQITTTPIFELARQEYPEKLVLTEEDKAKISEYNGNAKTRAEQLLLSVKAAPETLAEVASQNSEDPGSRANGGAYKGIKKGMFVPAYEEVIFNKLNVGEIYPELVETSYGFHIIKKDGESGEGDGREIDTSHILIQKVSEEQALKAKEFLATGINGIHIASLNSVPDEGQKLAVEITLTEKGNELLNALKESFKDANFYGYINGVNAGLAVIGDGKILLKGNFTEEDGKAMVDGFGSGAVHSTMSLAE